MPGVHNATIKGAEDGRLLIISGPAFVKLLQDFPAIVDQLAPRDDGDIHYGLSDAAWQEAQKLKLRRQVRASSAGALLPGERLEFFTRRSVWLLAGRLTMPVLLVLVGLVALVLMPTETGLQRALKYGAPIVLSLIGAAWFGLRRRDWRVGNFITARRRRSRRRVMMI